MTITETDIAEVALTEEAKQPDSIVNCICF